jgi:hypothetical protein
MRPPASVCAPKPVRHGRAWRFVAAPFLMGISAMTGTAESLPDGQWGGEQVMLSVGADKALLRLGCAQGEFAAPVRLDGKGRFSATGLFTAFAGGPSISAERPVEARYEGVLEDGRLTLTVRHGASSDSYRLTRGMQTKVIRCL